MVFKEMIDHLYNDRDSTSIKNDFGKVLILGGGKAYPNAPLISSLFAGASGVGFVSLGVPEDIYNIVASKSKLTFIHEPCDKDGDFLFYSDEHLRRIMESYSCILFGNGIRDCKENEILLTRLLKDYKKTLIIDATGLKLFSDISLRHYSSTVLLTPHLGEANRLFHTSLSSRNPTDYLSYATDFALVKGVNILLKSNRSVFVSKDGQVFDSSDYPETPCLAKAGSGDGLAGYLSGILAYALKKESLSDCVLFADKMIHEAAYLSQCKKTKGGADILATLDEMTSILRG